MGLPVHSYVRLLPLFTGLETLKIVQDRDMNKRKEACYLDIDNGLWGRSCRTSQIARENCALRCVSTACYNTIYADDPLEEGEIDIKRGRDIRHCLRREIQEEKLSSKHGTE
ncbi:hypothetical protein R1sor_003811 [Riccia sorocarpa]|uniref:Uncharacterized protein n=1 Tax=Riccia sorocarpa TaxID=122646 RepID=A0ABD3H8U9_9MARC